MKNFVYCLCLFLAVSCSDSNPTILLPLQFQGFDSSRMALIAPSGTLKIKMNQPVVWRSTGGTLTQEQHDTLTYTAPPTAGLQQVVIKHPDNASDSLLVNIAVTPNAALFKALQSGNHSIIFRHTAADAGVDQPANSTIPNWWKSCDSKLARQLNSQGLLDAAAIGQTLKRLQIPVGRVFSSEFCRCFTVAEKMETGLPVQQVNELTLSVYNEANRCEKTLRLAGNQPLDGKNSLFVGHAGITETQPNNCIVLNSLQWGDAAIFTLNADKTISLAGKIPVEDWTDLGK